MNKYTCLIILSLACSICNAQNLVPNGSFETLSSCPTAQGQLNLAVPWQMPPNMITSSSDLYNECNATGFGVPENPAGYQYARTGDGYAGGYVYGAGDLREYLQVQLTSPLSAGVTYKTEMYVSPAEMAGIAVDAIGMYFSTGAISGSGNSYPLPVTPQVSNAANTIISDTTGWTLVSGLYTAAGGEDYITIGNFADDAGTHLMVINSSGWGRGYYWVDDVSVSIATPVNELHGKDVLHIYPNPFMDKINVDTENNELLEITLYDISSRKIVQRTFTNTVSLNTEQLAKGMYLYEVRNKNGVIKKGKIVKE